MFTISIGFIAPESFGLALSFSFLAAIVVGGLATVSGRDLRRAVHRVRAGLRRGRQRGAGGRDLRRRADRLHVRAADGSGRPAAPPRRAGAAAEGRRRRACGGSVRAWRCWRWRRCWRRGCGRGDEDAARRRWRWRRGGARHHRHVDQARRLLPVQRPGLGLREHRLRREGALRGRERQGRRSTGASSSSSTLDDGYEPQRAVTNARRLVEQEKVFALFNTLGTPNNLAIWDYANQQKVPHVYVATGASAWGADVKPSTRTRPAGSPTTSPRPRPTPSSSRRRSRTRRSPCSTRTTASARTCWAASSRRIEGSDIKIVARESYEVTDPTITSQMRKLGASGGGHVPEHHDAEVLGAGDRGDRQVRLEAAAHPQQRRRVEEARARAGRPREREGHRLDDLLQGPRGPAVGRRRGDEGVQGRD